MTVTYVIDGAEVTGLERFWHVLGEAVNGPGGYFGRNLDALADCRRGGFGTPEDGDYVIEWRRHDLSRRTLAAETAKVLHERLRHAHPDRAALRAQWEEARAGRGPSVFDEPVAVFEEEAPGVLRLL